MKILLISLCFFLMAGCTGIPAYDYDSQQRQQQRFHQFNVESQMRQQNYISQQQLLLQQDQQRQLKQQQLLNTPSLADKQRNLYLQEQQRQLQHKQLYPSDSFNYNRRTYTPPPNPFTGNSGILGY